MDDHTILANDDSFGNVSVCPGGVVHVNLVHISLKLLPQDFIRLCELVSSARQHMDASHPPVGKARLHVVTSEADRDKTPGTTE